MPARKKRPPVERITDLQEVPFIVEGKRIAWSRLDYRMVYLLSLITPRTLTFEQVIEQARDIAEVTTEQAIDLLTALRHRGIIDTLPSS